MTPTDPIRTIREALATLCKYAEWQINEGTEWHPTLPSALAQAKAALETIPPAANAPNCGTQTGYDDILESLRRVDQSPALTVFKDGGYMLWGLTDAKYAEGDVMEGWLCTIPLPKAYDTKEMAEFIQSLRDPANVPEREGVDLEAVRKIVSRYLFQNTGSGAYGLTGITSEVEICQRVSEVAQNILEEIDLLAHPVPAQTEKDGGDIEALARELFDIWGDTPGNTLDAIKAIANRVISQKLAYEEEARKFQQETRRTSDLTVMLRRMIERLDHQGCKPGVWSKGCVTCQLVQDAQDLLASPINAAPSPPPDALKAADIIADRIKTYEHKLDNENGNPETNAELRFAIEALKVVQFSLRAATGGGKKGG